MWRSPQPGYCERAVLVEVALWLIIVIAVAGTELLLAARTGGKATIEGKITDRIMQALTVVALAGPPTMQIVVRGQHPLAVTALGGAIAALGVTTRVAAMVTLGKRYQLTPSTVRDTKRIVSHGIYGVVRHPGYLGLLLSFFGLAMLAAGIVGCIFVVPMVLGVIIRVRVEERLLLREFDGAYEDYVRAVRWKLIPHIT